MPDKAQVLIVASKLGYQTRIFADAAVRLGMEPVLATDRCPSLDDPWCDHALAVKFYLPEAAGDQLAQQASRVRGVVAVGDRPATVAAWAARKMGLRFHPVEAVEAARNKFVARERFRAAGLPAPEFHRVAVEEGAEAALGLARFPCVLKPLGLSGSRGVIRANDAMEFRAAFARIKTLLERPDVRLLREEASRYVQVEEYIDGEEYAVEGLVSGGRLRVLAIFDKPDPLEGPFFEETLYVTPSRAARERQAAIASAMQQAVTALGLTDGPLHAEARANAGGVWVLEVAARPIGGLCAHALRFNSGVPLEEVLLRHAVGEEIGPLTLDGPASGVMMIPIPAPGAYAGVTGTEKALAVPGIEDVEITAKAGQTLLQLPEGSSYLGFLFARGATSAGVERALRTAHSELEFRITPLLPMV